MVVCILYMQFIQYFAFCMAVPQAVVMNPADVFEITIGKCPTFAFQLFTHHTSVALKHFIAIMC